MIYIVMGSTGEYSDRREWLVKAFRHEEGAIKHVQYLEGKVLELGLKYEDVVSNIKYSEKDKLIKLMKEFDNKFDCDYTGTYYWVEDVEFEP